MTEHLKTRDRVRIIADQLIGKGIKPTPTIVREELGRGSPNTIVSELKAWRKDRTKKYNVTFSVDSSKERGGGTETKGVINEDSSELEQKLSSILECNQSIEARLDKLCEQFIENKSWMESEMNKAYERYEAVQKYALLQVDAAREALRQANERTENARAEASIREASLNRQILELRGRLKEALGEI